MKSKILLLFLAGGVLPDHDSLNHNSYLNGRVLGSWFPAAQQIQVSDMIDTELFART
jgi:hypothetical protein